MNDSVISKRGGIRPGSGRKTGSGRFHEPTQPIRVPVSLLPGLQALLDSHQQSPSLAGFDAIYVPALHPPKLPLPLFTGKVAAGFPSPADDYVDKTLDLNELLVQKPAATFFARAQGDSMLGAGIHPNDILVIDRSIEAVPGKIVVCALNGELTVKRLAKDGECWKLHAENPAYPDIPIHDDLELVIWGVVTNVIHAL